MTANNSPGKTIIRCTPEQLREKKRNKILDALRDEMIKAGDDSSIVAKIENKCGGICHAQIDTTNKRLIKI